MSETPRTDEFFYERARDPSIKQMLKLARTLERELTAERDALRAEVERLRGALLLADSLCKIALPKFNWGASALDAEAIKLLNETPGAIASAIRAAKEGS